MDDAIISVYFVSFPIMIRRDGGFCLCALVYISKCQENILFHKLHPSANIFSYPEISGDKFRSVDRLTWLSDGRDRAGKRGAQRMEDRDVSDDDDVAGDARPAIFTFSVNHTDRPTEHAKWPSPQRR